MNLNLLLVLSCVTLLVHQVESCNDNKCSSIISKCNSTISCHCEPLNCPCHKEFINCLGEQYTTECCSCMGSCPPKLRNNLSKKSHVEEFDGIPELFNVLITSKSEEFEWDIVTFPVIDLNLENDVNYNFMVNEENFGEDIKDQENNLTTNCSVIYLSSCISWNKCRQSCHNTGASSYRWFHDGCCECVGSECINYGLNESRCSRCPEPVDNEDEEKEIAEAREDYGDDDLFL